ncbi:hypothetical protein GCM10027299_45790 [Larkinella ripae]
MNDYTEEVEKWRTGSNNYLKKLTSPKVFMTAYIKDNTLAFSGVKIRVPGIPGTQPLDLDPDEMLKESAKLGRSFSREEEKKLNRPKQNTALSNIEIRFSSEGDVFISGKSFHISSGKSSPTVKPLLQIGDELIEIEN